MDSGVDLFKKFESNATLYMKNTYVLDWRNTKNAGGFGKQRAGLQEELAKYAEMNDTDSRLSDGKSFMENWKNQRRK